MNVRRSSRLQSNKQDKEKPSSYLSQEWDPVEVHQLEIKRKTRLLTAFDNLETMMSLNSSEIKAELGQLRQEVTEIKEKFNTEFKTELKAFKTELLQEMTNQMRVLLQQEVENIVDNKIKSVLMDAANNIPKRNL